MTVNWSIHLHSSCFTALCPASQLPAVLWPTVTWSAVEEGGSCCPLIRLEAAVSFWIRHLPTSSFQGLGQPYRYSKLLYSPSISGQILVPPPQCSRCWRRGKEMRLERSPGYSGSQALGPDASCLAEGRPSTVSWETELLSSQDLILVGSLPRGILPRFPQAGTLQLTHVGTA